MPPSSDQRLFDAQPPSTTPYRPSPAKPKMAARLAPIRSWISALTLRSKNTPRPITWSARKRAKRTFAAAMATSGVTLGAGQALDQGERPLDGQVLVVLRVVDLEHGRRVAGREALDLLEREPSVRGLLAGTDAEALFERGPDVVRPAQRARQVAADLEVPA